MNVGRVVGAVDREHATRGRLGLMMAGEVVPARVAAERAER